MTSALTSLKACVLEFNPDDQSDNLARKWQQWIENFELVLDYEGVTDPTDGGASKRRAALLTVGGQAFRDVFSTLTVTDQTYATAKRLLHTLRLRKTLQQNDTSFSVPDLRQQTSHTITGSQGLGKRVNNASLIAWG